MKISILLGPFLPLPPASMGAVEKRWLLLAREWANKGVDVEIVCKRGPNEPRQQVIGRLTITRLRGYRQTGSLAMALAQDFAYSARVVMRLPKADITVTNGFWLPVLCRFRSRQAGKLVVSVQRAPKGQMWLYRGAAMFDVVSTDVKRRVEAELGRSNEIVSVTPNPIDIGVFFPADERRVEETICRVLYVGRLHPEKGLHILIRAFLLLAARLPNTKLILCGPWDTADGGGGEGYLRDLTALGRGAAIQVIEPIRDESRLASLYRSVDVFCYPSIAERGETFGLAVLEAMAVGAVPVVSSLECFRDFVVEGESGLYFDHRGKLPEVELADKLELLISSQKLRWKMRIQAIEKAKKFAVHIIAEQYLKKFEEILGSKDAASV